MSEMINHYEKLEEVCRGFGFKTITVDDRGKFYSLDIEKSSQPTVTKDKYLSLVDDLLRPPINLKTGEENIATRLPQDFTYRGKTVLKIGLHVPLDTSRPFKVSRFVISKDYEERNVVISILYQY